MKRIFLFLSITVLAIAPAIGLDYAISFQPVPNQPYFATQPLNIDSLENDTLILRINAKHGGTGRLFWSNHYDPQFNPQKSLWFFVKAGEHDYYFNVPSQNPNWIGWTRGLIFLPEDAPSNIISVQAKALPGDLFSNIRSGWQEFWGPRGRLVIGSTINTMQSPTLFGQPIFVYIYWMLGICAVGILMREVFTWNTQKKKKASFDSVLMQAGVKLSLVLFVLWGLLECSNLYNNLLDIKDHLKYLGKSYPEKLMLVNTGDFYPFIQFCAQQIPRSASFDVRVPPVYFDIKSRYYLYPRQMTTIEADYLVIYDQAINPSDTAKYLSFKTFRPNALIMKKRGK